MGAGEDDDDGYGVDVDDDGVPCDGGDDDHKDRCQRRRRQPPPSNRLLAYPHVVVCSVFGGEETTHCRTCPQRLGRVSSSCLCLDFLVVRKNVVNVRGSVKEWSANKPGSRGILTKQSFNDRLCRIEFCHIGYFSR